jgi:hypothetical protein
MSNDMLPRNARRSRPPTVFDYLADHADGHPFLVFLGFGVSTGSAGFVFGYLGHGTGSLLEGEALGGVMGVVGFVVGFAVVWKKSKNCVPASEPSVTAPTVTSELRQVLDAYSWLSLVREQRLLRVLSAFALLVPGTVLLYVHDTDIGATLVAIGAIMLYAIKFDWRQ